MFLLFTFVSSGSTVPDAGVKVKVKLLSHVQLFATHGLYIPWNSPGQNTGVGESESEVAQSCLTLCDPMDGSLPGSAVHGIFQARILEWTAISFSRGSS